MYSIMGCASAVLKGRYSATRCEVSLGIIELECWGLKRLRLKLGRGDFGGLAHYHRICVIVWSCCTADGRETGGSVGLVGLYHKGGG